MFRISIVLFAVLAAGSAAAGEKAASTAFTLGLVQRELHTGLSQADLILRLGSPSILTRDGSGREAWVYDRVFSETEAKSAGIGVGGLGSGGGDSFAGLFGLNAGGRSARTRSSQRTLTVVVRFSAEGTVESFAWHDSRF